MNVYKTQRALYSRTVATRKRGTTMKYTKQQQEANDARARRAIVSTMRGLSLLASGLCGVLTLGAIIAGVAGLAPVAFGGFLVLTIHSWMMGD